MFLDCIYKRKTDKKKKKGHQDIQEHTKLNLEVLGSVNTFPEILLIILSQIALQVFSLVSCKVIK